MLNLFQHLLFSSLMRFRIKFGISFFQSQFFNKLDIWVCLEFSIYNLIVNRMIDVKMKYNASKLI